MGRTISVESVVEVFDDYLNDSKRKQLEKMYNIINSSYTLHGYNLSIKELLFKKIYECYMQYENGEIGLEDELDSIEYVIGCDKYSKDYYINTVDELFKNCVNAMYNESYGEEAFNLFPDFIDKEYFVNCYDYDEEPEEAIDYGIMTSAAEAYLRQEFYKINTLHSVINREEESVDFMGIKTERIPDEIINQFLDEYSDLKGTEVYDFGIGLDKEEGDNWWDEAEFLLADFWKVRLKIMEALYVITKMENGEADEKSVEWYDRAKLLNMGFREQYNKLSLDDFKMTDDFRLKIVNNQEVYKLFGIDEKYLECETELEEELGR